MRLVNLRRVAHRCRTRACRPVTESENLVRAGFRSLWVCYGSGLHGGALRRLYTEQRHHRACWAEVVFQRLFAQC